MAVFCPNFNGVNMSATPMITFSGKAIKPDVTYYNCSGESTGSDVEKAELMVEAKFDDQDAFDDRPNAKDFLRESDRARQTLGQLTSYATVHLAALFRTHVFSVLL